MRLRLALVLLCLALWLPGLTTLPPGDRDESRFALATRQMIETGDPVRIMNGHVPRWQKPIGIYWLQAPFAAAIPARTNPIWPYRLPSLLGGIAAVLATFEIGLALGLARAAAGLAAALLAACAILAVETHIAKTDAVLLGAVAWMQLGLARAYAGQARRRDAALFWAALGVGILLKGPIAPLVAGVTAGTLALLDRRAAVVRQLRPLWGMPLALAIVLPWLAAIGIATHGAFFAASVGSDLGGKLGGGAQGHGAPPGLHLLLLPLLAFPGTAAILAAARPAWRDRAALLPRFCWAWLAAWPIFELVPTKLPHYTLPLYPALFLLAATAPRVGRLAVLVTAMAAGLLAAVCVAAPVLFGVGWWLGVPAALCALAAGGLAARGRPGAAVLAAVPLHAALLGFVLPRLTPIWVSPRLVAALPPHAADGSDVAVAGFAEPSLMFLLGPELLQTLGGAAATRPIAIIEAQALPAFRAAAGDRYREIATVAGFNTSRGRPVRFGIWVRRAGSPDAAGAAVGNPSAPP